MDTCTSRTTETDLKSDFVHLNWPRESVCFHLDQQTQTVGEDYPCVCICLVIGSHQVQLKCLDDYACFSLLPFVLGNISYFFAQINFNFSVPVLAAQSVLML